MENLGTNNLDVKRELDIIYGYRLHKKLGKELYGSTLKLLEKNIFGKLSYLSKNDTCNF